MGYGVRPITAPRTHHRSKDKLRDDPCETTASLGFVVTPRIKRFLGWGGLLSATLIVSLGLMEVGTRIVSPQPPSWLDIYREHPDLPFYVLQPNLDRVMDTGESSYRVRTDTEGFRIALDGPPRFELPEVLVLGDSFTFGQGIAEEDRFSNRLEHLLNRNGPRN